VWVLTLVIAVVLISSLLSDALTTRFDFVNTPESKRGVDLIEKLRGVPFSTNEVVIIESDTLTVDDEEFKQFAEQVFSDLQQLVRDRGHQGGDAHRLLPDRCPHHGLRRPAYHNHSSDDGG
jgi:hypothetical protein